MFLTHHKFVASWRGLVYNFRKKVFPFIVFIVFQMTGLSSQFQYSNRFWKICIGSWVICQNAQKLEGLVWQFQFWNEKDLFPPYLLYPRATFPSWQKKSIYQTPPLYRVNFKIWIYLPGLGGWGGVCLIVIISLISVLKWTCTELAPN